MNISFTPFRHYAAYLGLPSNFRMIMSKVPGQELSAYPHVECLLERSISSGGHIFFKKRRKNDDKEHE